MELLVYLAISVLLIIVVSFVYFLTKSKQKEIGGMGPASIKVERRTELKEDFLPSARFLSYKPSKVLKYGPSVSLVLFLILILFMWSAVFQIVKISRRDSINMAKKSMTSAATNFTNELSQKLMFTQQTTNLLENNINDKDFFPNLSSVYLGDNDLSLHLLDKKGKLLWQSKTIDHTLIELTPEELDAAQNLEDKLLLGDRAKENLRIVYSMKDTANKKTYAVYWIPKETFMALGKEILTLKTGRIEINNHHPLIAISLNQQAHPQNTNIDPVTVVSMISGYSVRLSADYDDALSEFNRRYILTMEGIIVATTFMSALCVVGILAMSLLRANAKKMHEMVSLDGLTHLPNRRSFHELMKEQIDNMEADNKFLGLLFIDLDNFKYVNDNLGHHAGDVLLKQVAKRLSRSIRASDIAFRLGGDEFTVLLPNLINGEQAINVAQRIIDALWEPFMIEGHQVKTKGSIGLALMPLQAKTAAELIRYADTAMYHAKASGKGCFFLYNESMTPKDEKVSLPQNLLAI